MFFSAKLFLAKILCYTYSIKQLAKFADLTMGSLKMTHRVVIMLIYDNYRNVN